MHKAHDGPRGEVQRVWHQSRVLRDNPLGDPWRRELAIYLPARWEALAELPPVLFALAGFTGSGLSHLAWRGFTENLPERLDRLIASGALPPVAVAMPDCFTALGGNQYLNSSAIGRYDDYLVHELVPFVEDRFPVRPGRAHRGVFGKSSGGYGALMQACRHPDVWAAAACHSGDLYFEFAYRRDLPLLLDVLARYEHSVERFVKAFHARNKPRGDEIHALMLIAMAASYDPDPDAPLGVRLPLDLRTGRLDERAWARWLAHDPVELIETCSDALRTLRILYVDCGTRDQYYLHYGARQLRDRLAEAGIACHYEEFDDDHSGLDYRLDVSLPLLTRALQ